MATDARVRFETHFAWLLDCWRFHDDLRRADTPLDVLLAAARDLDDARRRVTAAREDLLADAYPATAAWARRPARRAARSNGCRA